MTAASPRRSTISPAWWVGLSALCVAIDYSLGPFIQFPIVYLVPVSLAAWHNGRNWSLALALILPVCRLYFTTLWVPPWTFLESSVNALIRIAVLGTFAFLVDRTARQTRALAAEVSMLEGMLPVCSACKMIRDNDTSWKPLERYVMEHPHDFERSLCPACQAKATEIFDRR